MSLTTDIYYNSTSPAISRTANGTRNLVFEELAQQEGSPMDQTVSLVFINPQQPSYEPSYSYVQEVQFNNPINLENVVRPTVNFLENPQSTLPVENLVIGIVLISIFSFIFMKSS
ncbi:hypothetical protein [Moorena producens]|uniref:hypothetical protein n=1 Tax=Moorena producens TaxID=1155739 RepID=UPI003C746929